MCPNNKKREQGASLIIVMVMLTVLMVLGISAYVASTTQFRVAANLQFQNVALGNAESALATAEAWIGANYNNAGFTTRSSGGLYPLNSNPDPLTMTWDDTTSVKADTIGAQRFTIEIIVSGRDLPANSVANCQGYGMTGPCPKVNVYRITARGTSILGTTKVVQSVFAVRVTVL